MNDFIPRIALNKIHEKLEKGKVLVLYGPRRVGKTEILEKLVQDKLLGNKVKLLKGEKTLVQNSFSENNPEKMVSFFGKDIEVVIIDEAQKIENIGERLKILVDEYKTLKIIASGSASFVLRNQLGEPLTGRKKNVMLYPLSAGEIIKFSNRQSYLENLEQYLIYGGYPEIYSRTSFEDKKEYLLTLIDDYLFRDILDIERLKNSKKLRDLLTLLAFQIGKEVSLNELSKSLEIHKDTVYKYLDLLEKSFIIINIRGFSRNLRKEVNKTSRWYFIDNGVRNALINNFNSLEQRQDVGQMWENYLVMERIKKQSYDPIFSNNYFWRTYDQKEIDWVEEREGKLFGYEIKWGNKKTKEPKIWKQTYEMAEYKVINRDNFLDFIL